MTWGFVIFKLENFEQNSRISIFGELKLEFKKIVGKDSAHFL